MILKNYFDRIDAEHKSDLSLSCLRELQNRHLLSVPFENLDIHHGSKISLNPDEIYDKIVNRKRGGYCYELNSLFAKLLKELGYKLDIVSARVFNPQKAVFGQEFDHLTIIVHLERSYLVDVGFGDSFREPIALPDGEAEDVSGKYRIENSNSNEFQLSKFEGAKYVPQFRFTNIPRSIYEFAGMNEYHQTSSLSSFTQGMLCTVATPVGRITLNDKSLTVTLNSQKIKTCIKSQGDFYAQLEKYFGIKLK